MYGLKISIIFAVENRKEKCRKQVGEGKQALSPTQVKQRLFFRMPMQSKRSYEQNERNDETKIKSLAMMVKRNTPARQRQKRGATARSEAKKSKATRFTLARQSTLA